MKRSEVINLIADYFYHCNVDSEECLIKADNLLRQLQETGLIQPSYLGDKGQYGIVRMNGWEPEGVTSEEE